MLKLVDESLRRNKIFAESQSLSPKLLGKESNFIANELADTTFFKRRARHLRGVLAQMHHLGLILRKQMGLNYFTSTLQKYQVSKARGGEGLSQIGGDKGGRAPECAVESWTEDRCSWKNSFG